jgi:adenylate kinase family enzyme
MSITVVGKSDTAFEIFEYVGHIMDKDAPCQVFGYNKIEGELLYSVTRPGTTTVQYQNESISVTVKQKGDVVSGNESPEIYYEVILTGKNNDLLKAFLKDAKKYCTPRSDKKKVVCRRYANGTYWCTYAKKKKKGFDTVFLPEKDVLDVKNSLGKFLSAEDEYATYGMPYKIVFLFTGGAGLGKSTLAFALASQFDLDLYVYSFCDHASDSSLIRAVHDMDHNSLLLLEDVDAGLEQHKITMNAITNITDGSLVRDRMVVIMTTNYIDRLNEILLRPGRIDKILKIELPTPEIVHRIVTFYRKDDEEIVKRIAKTFSSRCYPTAAIISFLFWNREKPIQELEQLAKNDVGMFKREPSFYHS